MPLADHKTRPYIIELREASWLWNPCFGAKRTCEEEGKKDKRKKRHSAVRFVCDFAIDFLNLEVPVKTSGIQLVLKTFMLQLLREFKVLLSENVWLFECFKGSEVQESQLQI